MIEQGERYNDLASIDARLAELEQEKTQLIALKSELLNSQHEPSESPLLCKAELEVVFSTAEVWRKRLYDLSWFMSKEHLLRQFHQHLGHKRASGVGQCRRWLEAG